MYSTLVQPGPGGAPGDCLSPLHPYSDAGFARDCAICFLCVGEVCNKVKSDKQFTSGGSADVELSRPLHPPPPPRARRYALRKKRGEAKKVRGVEGDGLAARGRQRARKLCFRTGYRHVQAYTHFARSLPLCHSPPPLSHTSSSVHTRTHTHKDLPRT